MREGGRGEVGGREGGRGEVGGREGGGGGREGGMYKGGKGGMTTVLGRGGTSTCTLRPCRCPVQTDLSAGGLRVPG